jgi:signal transduction histidine kinase/CheY-like chemotaxis protein
MNKHASVGSMFDRRSIRYPLVQLIVSAVLLSIGLALISDAYLMLNSVREDIRRTMNNAANAAGTAANAAVVFKDAVAAQDVLRMFEAYPEVDAAALYIAQGPLLASFGQTSLLPQNAPNILATSAEIHALATTAQFHLPIEVDNSVVGSVYIHAHLDRYWQTYFKSITTTFLVALSAGALVLFFAMRFLNRIILPVRMLAESANDARLLKNFIPRDIPAADNEIGDLVNKFNELLLEVELGRKQLQNQHAQLEKQVAERTAELLAAKNSADEANAAKSRFLSAASHDLRQPIHAMHLFQETLSKTPLNQEQRQISNYLALSTQNLAEMLNTLLDVSRLDGGGIKPNLETVSCYAMLCKIEAEFAPLAMAKGLRFKFYFPNGELYLFTDASMLFSQIRNLIDNAIKYTQTGGVLVGFRRRPSHVLIQVWDTGIGIDPNHFNHLFDEYFQASNPQRDRTRGLGLGLSIAKRVENLLGTQINFCSRLNKGSMFQIRVPLATHPEANISADAIPQQTEASTTSLSGLRLTIIEDDIMAAKALELALTATGMIVSNFASAEAALADEHIEDSNFYIVDYRLPGMNGIQFLDTIGTRVKNSIKATLLTGEAHQEMKMIKQAHSQGWQVLFKPISYKRLMAEIRAQIKPLS